MSLPPVFPFLGDWPQYEDELYEIFIKTFVDAKIRFQGLPVNAKFVPKTKNKAFGFWHLISEGETENDRIPDLARCERIRWVAWVIQNADIDPKLTWWENERYGNVHVVIWHEDESFAVVLAKRKDYYVLKTAYLVKEHRKQDFLRERESYRRAQKG